jgi:uncharacterized membrane protein YidH (DUF202 family)
MNQPSQKTIATLDKINIASLFIFTAFCMFSISITQIAAFFGGLAWLLRTHLTGNWQEQRWPLGITIVLFVLACLIAVVNAFDPSYSYKELRKLLEILIFFWVANCARENGLRNSLSILLICSAALASIPGLYQWFLDNINIGNRFEGTMSTYMTFAGLAMMVGLYTLGRILFRRPLEYWFFIPLGIITAGLLFTLTRQAWFGFLIGALFLVSILEKRILWVFTVLLLTFIFLSSDHGVSNLPQLSLPDVVKTFESSKDAGITSEKTQGEPKIFSTDSIFYHNLKFRVLRVFDGKDETLNMRLSLWEGGWLVFRDYPLTGCGFKCMDLIHHKYPDPTGVIERLRGMHNNFIQLAVDTGVLGLSAWLGIWICFFILISRRIKILERNSDQRWIAYASSAAVIAFLAGGCFESSFYDSEVSMLLWFIMALPFADSNLNGPGKLNAKF